MEPMGGRMSRGAARSSGVVRTGAFVLGLLLVLVGVAMWLFSIVLTVPPVLAGLWVWSRHFGWGRRLFDSFLGRARRLWARVRKRPVRWTLLTVGGLTAAGAGYAVMASYDVMGKVLGL